MTSKAISGVYAAVLTPRHADDRVDTGALTTLVQFLENKGISSYALNGATGEYCLTTPDHLRTVLETVQRASGGHAKILCGVGAAGTALTLELAAIAQEFAVDGLLLPMPMFFPYEQEDLELFCRTIATSTTLPILLYNLPQFTTGLAKETVARLITEVPNIIGIKDSSGSLDILRHLDASEIEACRIIGNDAVLAQALSEGCCDGVVSGVACALPEVITALYRAAPSAPAFHTTSTMLDQFIEQLNPFPTPWGLKLALEARGVLTATFAQPVTTHRRQQAQEMAEWLQRWLPEAVSHTVAS